MCFSLRLNWESVLLVKNVSSADYGAYDCVAQNEKGMDRLSIVLNVTSRPDRPTLLSVQNLTYDSVTLKWTAGFNGGFKQAFRIRLIPSSI